jgi:hypothetical protein
MPLMPVHQSLGLLHGLLSSHLPGLPFRRARGRIVAFAILRALDLIGALYGIYGPAVKPSLIATGRSPYSRFAFVCACL